MRLFSSFEFRPGDGFATNLLPFIAMIFTYLTVRAIFRTTD